MGATQLGRGTFNGVRHPVHVALIVVAGLAAGCGVPHTSSVLHTAAPLPAGVTVAYVVGGSAPPTASGLVGLKGSDGADAWHAPTGEPNSQAAPVEIKGMIYTEGGSDQAGTVAAVRAADGHILWRAPLPSGTGADDRDFRIAADGITVVVTDPTAGLYALDAATGAVRWHLDVPATWPLAVRDGIAVATLPNPQAATAHVVAYREDNGKLLWQGSDFPYGATGGVGTIGINHTAVYTAGQSGVTAYAAPTGTQLWHQEIAGNIAGVDDRTITIGILGGMHSVASLDAGTGSTIWSAGPSDGSWSWLSMVQTPTELYVTDGGTHVIALSMMNGSQLWQVAFPSYRVGAISQVQGVVFAMLLGPPETSGPQRLIALDGARGTVYWERDQSIYFLVSTPL